MATRKQRKRREKEMRHEYVWEDAEGNEIEPPAPTSRANGSGSKAKPESSSGGGRRLQPPSWSRTFKRGLIFAPIFLGVVLLLNGGQGIAFALINTFFLLVVFVPFSYLIDKVMWRSFQKREARSGEAAKKS
ncbi:MAG TPA: hypothetical protein VH950_07485 [Gaiellaceae bacterium]